MVTRKRESVDEAPTTTPELGEIILKVKGMWKWPHAVVPPSGDDLAPSRLTHRGGCLENDLPVSTPLQARRGQERRPSKSLPSSEWLIPVLPPTSPQARQRIRP